MSGGGLPSAHTLKTLGNLSYILEKKQPVTYPHENLFETLTVIYLPSFLETVCEEDTAFTAHNKVSYNYKADIQVYIYPQIPVLCANVRSDIL